ncbi:MAG: ribosomal protein L7/L12, partial [Nannocystaceae bacterium]
EGSRIGLMKVLRECFGLSLHAAKGMVDAAGDLVIAVDLDKPEADMLGKRLRAAGAVIEIRS